MTTTAPAPAAPAAEEAKGGKKKLIMIVVAVAVAGAAAWFLFLKPAGPPKPPEPGEVLPLEAIQVNLEGGHYLRIGLALQLTATAHEADGSKALDVAIDLYSGRSVAELADPAERRKLKKELLKELDHSYHGDVMDVYLTEFVMQ